MAQYNLENFDAAILAFEQAKKYKKPNSDLLGSLKIIIRTVGALILPLAATLFYLMWSQVDWAPGISFAEQLSSPEYQQIVIKTAGAMIGMIPSGLFLLTSMALAVGVFVLHKTIHSFKNYIVLKCLQELIHYVLIKQEQSLMVP